MSHWFQEAVVNLSVEFSLFPTVYVNDSPLNAFFFSIRISNLRCEPATDETRIYNKYFPGARL